MNLGAESAGFYSMAPLQDTLGELVDFRRIDEHTTRLTVGAANVRTGEMRYFDSRDMRLDVRHVMASGALPPAFAPVRIDGDLYWDGGILSNTPVEAIFDNVPRRNSLAFVVHIWNPAGSEPKTVWEVLNRQKDVQYSSRAAMHIARQKQLHRLRHVVSELVRRMPEELRQNAEVQELAEYGCLTRMHVVRLLAPTLDGDDYTKDIDFSPWGIRARWEAGYADTQRVIARARGTASSTRSRASFCTRPARAPRSPAAERASDATWRLDSTGRAEIGLELASQPQNHYVKPRSASSWRIA